MKDALTESYLAHSTGLAAIMELLDGNCKGFPVPQSRASGLRRRRRLKPRASAGSILVIVFRSRVP